MATTETGPTTQPESSPATEERHVHPIIQGGRFALEAAGVVRRTFGAMSTAIGGVLDLSVEAVRLQWQQGALDRADDNLNRVTNGAGKLQTHLALASVAATIAREKSEQNDRGLVSRTWQRARAYWAAESAKEMAQRLQGYRDRQRQAGVRVGETEQKIGQIASGIRAAFRNIKPQR